MAINIERSAFAVSNTVAFASDNVAGNLLVCTIAQSANVTAMSDTRNGNYTKAVDNDGGAALGADIWYYPNCAAGSNTLTQTNAFGSAFCYIGAIEISGMDTTSPLDQTNNHFDTTGANNSGNVTTTLADEILFGASSNNGGRSATWNNSFTELYDNQSAGAGRAGSFSYRIVNATGTYSSDVTLSAGADCVTLIATFKMAAAGGTNYTQSLSGTLTPSGAVSKLTSKALS